MGQNPTQQLANVAHLFSQIQEHMEMLPPDSAGIAQLFFDSQCSISELARIHQLPANEIRQIISCFLVSLLNDSPALQQFLSRSCPDGQGIAANIEQQVHLVVETCDTQESIGARVRELIGAALRVRVPPVPPNIWIQAISQADSIAEPPVGQTVRLPVKLSEPDFFLGRQRRAAGNTVLPAGKTYSDGTVTVERGHEQIEVGFTIVRQDKPTGEYWITFRNLPLWATPVALSFVAPYEGGGETEYRLPIEYREHAFCLEVESREQETAFLDRTGVYIQFMLAQTPGR
jgi:hypothetical protein